MLEKVGLIPLKDYIRNLDLRNYSRGMIVKYTKNTYNLDITEELRIYEKENGLLWNGNFDIYDSFEKEFPLEKNRRLF